MGCDQLQQWADDNGVKGIRFYPLNPSESSAESIIDSALKTINALEEGRTIGFKDTVRPEDVTEEHKFA